MVRFGGSFLGLVAAMVLLLCLSAEASSLSAKCQAAKLTEIGKYGLCLFKAEGRAVKSSKDPLTAGCELKLAKKWAKAEEKALGACPTMEDRAELAGLVEEHLAEIARLLAPIDEVTAGNTALFEIEGVGAGDVVMIQGPGLELQLERNDLENPWDAEVSGVEYRSIVFEAGEEWAAGLQCFLQNSLDPEIAERHSGSLVIRDSLGDEAIRWNLYELALVHVGAGSEGRLRYRFSHLPAESPTVTLLERLPSSFPHVFGGVGDAPGQPGSVVEPVEGASLLEIEGVGTTYGVVTNDPAAKRLTVTTEGRISGQFWLWFDLLAQAGYAGAGSIHTRSITVTELDAQGAAIDYRFFFSASPLSYEHLSGFQDPDRIRERFVFDYYHFED